MPHGPEKPADTSKQGMGNGAVISNLQKSTIPISHNKPNSNAVSKIMDKGNYSTTTNASRTDPTSATTTGSTGNGGEKCLTVRVSPRPRPDLEIISDLQTRHKFATAVHRQNQVANAAITSLDNLSKQLLQHVLTTAVKSERPKDGGSLDPVRASVELIHRLLMEAQSGFGKMVEENTRLAIHIDTSLQTANQEVSALKAELASTSRSLRQLRTQDKMGRVDISTQVENDLAGDTEKLDSDKEDMMATVQSLSSANEQLLNDYKNLIEDHDSVKCALEDYRHENEALKTENARLEMQMRSLRKDLDDLRQAKSEGAPGLQDRKPSYGELKLELIQTRQELNRAKEVLQGMKSDRKRLKGEKLDLLSQMKQLYTTLEEKETELRDFIRNYEQRVKESDEMIKQLMKEKDILEKDKWEILTKAREAAERALMLKTQLNTREDRIAELHGELLEAKDQLSNQDSQVTSSSNTPSNAAAANNNSISEEESVAMEDSIIIDDDNGFSTMEESSVLNDSFSSSPQLNHHSFDFSSDTSGANFKWFTQSTDLELTAPVDIKPSKKKKKPLGSLTKVFSRGKMRRSVAVPRAESLEDPNTKLNVLTAENYGDKLNTIEQMVGIHMRDWRAGQVLAWLEITLGMSMYAEQCMQNVKSGKVLLGLSDNELSSALGVTNPLHRRKLRLAIEQHRNPNDISQYPRANEMDPVWVAHRLLPDLGLPQYTAMFEQQLIDGPVLNTLTRKDLEKHCSVHRKMHQTSILHAIELLRRIDFNKEKLYQRRNLCEEKDLDLIVWTNERLIRWTRSIDLGEYSDALLESGLHGALMVLEPTFNSDLLAATLGIPPNKSYIRRHLTSELDTILRPARRYQKGLSLLRCAVDVQEPKDKLENGSAGKFTRGQRKGSADEGRARLSFRGSLGRAFGKKVKDDLKMNFDNESYRPATISAPIPLQHSSLSNLANECELVKKGFCLPGCSLDGSLNVTSEQKNVRQNDGGDLASRPAGTRKALAISDQTLYHTGLSELAQNLSNFSSNNEEKVRKNSQREASQETLTDQNKKIDETPPANNAIVKPKNSGSSSSGATMHSSSSSGSLKGPDRKCAIRLDPPSVTFDKNLTVVTSKPPIRPTNGEPANKPSIKSSSNNPAVKPPQVKPKGPEVPSRPSYKVSISEPVNKQASLKGPNEDLSSRLASVATGRGGAGDADMNKQGANPGAKDPLPQTTSV